MKKLVIVNFLIGILILALISGCTKGKKTEMRYHSILASGELIDISFYLYFNNQTDVEKVLEKKDKFIHALNLMFNSYKKHQLSEARINSVLKNTGNMVFDNSVKDVELKSIKYRN
ncbi:MAG: hypothetical protein RBR53_10230 [Desulforegulaceae bacterium]|nr:hypothetical protein [Desulforegulaceae bacterium]